MAYRWWRTAWQALSLCSLLVCADLATAQTAPQCVGLVLGGGGARGASHIGVLKVLERERIPICAIAGTSMGAIVGGLYASGYSPDEIEAVLIGVNWRDLFLDDPSRIDLPMRRKEDDLRYLLSFKLGFRDGKIQLPRGLIQGQKLLLLLRRLLISTWQVQDFDRLQIPFRCIGTDIGAGKRVVFERGDLALAMRASMSVPAAFAPIRVDGKLMVDGGIVDNVPVDVARAMGASALIVVNAGEPLVEETELTSPISVTMQMITAMMDQRTAEVLQTLAPQDVLITPDLGHFSSAAFDKVAETIPKGADAADAVLDRLRRFSVSQREYDVWQGQHRKREFDAPLIEFVDVVKTRSRTAKYVERQLADVIDKPLDVELIERDLGSAYGNGPYERISYQVLQREGKTGLIVTPVDKGWGPGYITFGLQLSDDFNGRSNYQFVTEFTETGLNSKGAEWRNRLGIGRETALHTEVYQPFGDLGQYFVQPYLDYRAQPQPVIVDSAEVAEYRVARYAAGVEAGWSPRATLELKAGVFRGREAAELKVGLPEEFTDIDSNLGAFNITLTHDTLDNAQFPSSGSRTELEFTGFRSVLGAERDGESLRANWDQAMSFAGSNRLLLGTRFTTQYGHPDVFEAGSLLGGFTNLSGFTERELFGAHTVLGRAIYYRRFGDSGSLFSIPAYVGGSIETGNVYAERQDISLDSLIWAGSIFVGVETIFGPVFLGYGRADTGDSSFYLNFTSLLRPRL